MDPVKAKSAQPVKAPEAAKRVTQQEDKPQAKPEAVAAKKAYEQPPRTTTNTRGETLGRHLNVTA
jgi:hypothetical protein